MNVSIEHTIFSMKLIVDFAEKYKDSTNFEGDLMCGSELPLELMEDLNRVFNLNLKAGSKLCAKDFYFFPGQKTIIRDYAPFNMIELNKLEIEYLEHFKSEIDFDKIEREEVVYN